jgi:hypothetical protein
MSLAISAAGAARAAMVPGLRTTPAPRRTTAPLAYASSSKTFTNRGAGRTTNASSSSSSPFARGGPLGLGTTHSPLRPRPRRGSSRRSNGGGGGKTRGVVAVRAVAAALAPALHALEHAAWDAEGTVRAGAPDIFESHYNLVTAGASHRVSGMPCYSRGYRVTQEDAMYLTRVGNACR